MNAKEYLKTKGIHPTEPIYWDLENTRISLDELMDEFAEQQVKLCNKPAVMGSLPDDAKIAEVARNYFPFEKPYSTNTGGMDVNYPKQYGFILGAKWIIDTLKGQ